MSENLNPKATPWVWRILLANAIVLMLMQTVVRSDAFLRLVWFDPSQAIARPWTFLSYSFVHADLLHLLTNSVALFVFGPLVERRLGSTNFLFYYLFCAVGGAILSLSLWSIAPQTIAPFVGASAAVLGVAFAFARFLPKATLLVFPLPKPIRARTLVILFAAYDVFGAWLATDNIAHVAHLGGMVFGWVFFRLRPGQDPEPVWMPGIHTRTTTAAGTMLATPQTRVSVPQPYEISAPRKESPQEVAARKKAEINRLLDKISASGIQSLTGEERQLLESQRRNESTD